MTESFYDVLGVSETADQEEITAAYREKVKEYHPDVSDRDDAAERFKAVTRAEEVLGDETERARYDRLGHDAYVRHLDGANAAGNERSPWTNADGSGGAGEPNDATSAGRSSTRERARSAADADDKYESSQHRRQRRRRRAHERRADASWTVGGEGRERSSTDGTAGGTAGSAASTDAGRTASNGGAAGASSSAGTDGGAASSAGTGTSTYTVHDWEATDRSFIGERPSLTRNELLQTVILGLLYPALLYSSVTPAFSLL